MSGKTEKRKRGDRGERRTALYLILRGYRILERNYTYGHKEIDVIAKKKDVIAFVEVKTRKDLLSSPGQSAVNLSKRRSLIAAAEHYRATHDTYGMSFRFDVAEVSLSGGINYIRNAFSD